MCSSSHSFATSPLPIPSWRGWNREEAVICNRIDLSNTLKQIAIQAQAPPPPAPPHPHSYAIPRQAGLAPQYTHTHTHTPHTHLRGQAIARWRLGEKSTFPSHARSQCSRTPPPFGMSESWSRRSNGVGRHVRHGVWKNICAPWLCSCPSSHGSGTTCAALCSCSVSSSGSSVASQLQRVQL